MIWCIKLRKQSGSEGGGGGHTISMTLEETKFRLQDIKQDLKIVAHRAKFWSDQNHKSTYVPAQPTNKYTPAGYIGLEFLTHPLFLETVEKMKINVSDDDCKDLQGQSEDGSVDLSGFSICLSAQRLSKIPVQFFYSESIALAVHEVSHLMGEDEATAQLIQKDLIWRKNLLNTFLSDYRDLIYRVGSAKFYFPSVDYFLNSKNESRNTCYDIATIHERIRFILPWVANGVDSILPRNHPLSVESNINVITALNDFEQTQSDCRGSKPFSATTIKRLKSASEIIKKALADFEDFVIIYDSPDQRLRKDFPKK